MNGRRWPWVPTYERIAVENASLKREDVITCGYFYTLIKYIFLFLSILNSLIGCEVDRIRVGTIRPRDTLKPTELTRHTPNVLSTRHDVTSKVCCRHADVQNNDHWTTMLTLDPTSVTPRAQDVSNRVHTVVDIYRLALINVKKHKRIKKINSLSKSSSTVFSSLLDCMPDWSRVRTSQVCRAQVFWCATQLYKSQDKPAHDTWFPT